MSKIFLSYSRKDKAIAQRIASTLESCGHQLWWDEQLIPGEAFRTAIRQKLDEVDCVLVLWSKHSVTSEWVQEEASLAHERKMLVPALMEDVEPPMPFGGLQAADLRNWNSDTNNREFQRLLDALGSKSSATPPLENQQYTHTSPAPVKNSHPAFIMVWKKWLAKHKKLSIGTVLGLFFSGFLLIGEVTGTFLNFEQVWKRFDKVPELELSYSPEGRVYAHSRINLSYQAPPRGYISLWNQESPDSTVVRLIPNPTTDANTTQPLSEVFFQETVQIKPTYSNGIERYTLLWTPERHSAHLPRHRYLNRVSFEQALKTLQTQNDMVSKTIEIPVFLKQ